MEVKNWFDENGDKTLALNWPLTEDSHVWEIGGFEGRWAQQIWDKFQCNITIFEPQDWAVGRMRKRFADIDKIEIRPYGLWTESKTLDIRNFETDGATVEEYDGEKVSPGWFEHFFPIVRDFHHPIDVCLMNIEGAEYRLIPAFMAAGVLTKFEYFWCQFHTVQDPDLKKTERIFEQFEKTHTMLWNCFPTAVAWRKR